MNKKKAIVSNCRGIELNLFRAKVPSEAVFKSAK
jgi:hypothetical protein